MGMHINTYKMMMMIVLVLQYAKIVLYNNHLVGFQFFKFLRYVISVAPFFHNIFPSECQVTQQDYHCVKTTHSKRANCKCLWKYLHLLSNKRVKDNVCIAPRPIVFIWKNKILIVLNPEKLHFYHVLFKRAK